MPDLISILCGIFILFLIITAVVVVVSVANHNKKNNFVGDQSEYEGEQRQESEMHEDYDDARR